MTSECSRNLPALAKPFVPPEHWLVGSQIDMNGFIEAAVYVHLFVTL